MWIRLTDVLVATATLLVLATASLLVAQQANEQNLRYRCHGNLRMIAQALLIYGNDNRGSFPRGRVESAEKDPKPTWGTPYEQNEKLAALPGADPFAGEARTQPHDVTAALFLLLRTVQINSDAFVCPSTGRKPWDYGGGQSTAKHWTNWKGNAGIREHLGYSYQNPYPSHAAIGLGFKLNNSTSAEFATAADMNRGVEELVKLTPASPMSQLRAANSLNHGGDGQNVAYGDTHVEWLKTPLGGIDGDNVYTFGRDGRRPRDKQRDMQPEPANGIVGSPVDEKDSILLPTARDVGLLEDKAELEAAAQRRLDIPEYDAITEQLVGKYTLARNNMTLDLEITPTRLHRTGGVTEAYSKYEVRKVEGDTIHVRIGDEEPRQKLTTFEIAPDVVIIKDHREFAGDWKRKP